MVINKYSGPFSQSFDSFSSAIRRKEIVVSHHRIHILNQKGKLAERIVTCKISHEKISLIDKIMNFVLHLFSNEYREAKKTIHQNLIQFRQDYFKSLVKLPKNLPSKLPAIEKVPLEKRTEPFPLLKLPLDIQREVFSHLDRFDIQSVENACDRLKATTKDLQFQINLIENHTTQFSLKELIDVPDDCRKLIKRLDLSHIYRKLTDDQFIQLLSLYPHLNELSLHYCPNITSKGFEKITKLKNLEILKLEHCKNLSTKDVQVLLGLKNLKHLKLHNSKISEEGLENIHELNKLQVLDLDTKISKKTLEKIVHLNNLKVFLYHACHLGDEDLKLITQMHQLETLEILNMNNNFSDKVFENIVNLQELKILKLANISKQGFAQIVGLKNLHTLSCDVININDQEFEKIASLEGLKELTISRASSLTDLSLNVISQLKHLQYLDLSINGFSENGLEKIKDLNLKTLKGHYDIENFDIFSQFKHLEVLELSNSDLTDDSLEKILELDHLRFLNLQECKGITDKGFTKIHKSKKIESLNLSYCNITGLTIKKLAKIQTLRKLNLSSVKLNEKDLSYLSKIKNLDELILNRVHIKDKDLDSILSLQMLRKLDLRRCQISDAGLKKLQNLRRLESLKLDDDPRITEAGLKLMKDALPHVKILLYHRI